MTSGRQPRALFYREEIRRELSRKQTFAEVALNYNVFEEDVFDIYYYSKLTSPSYLEQQVQKAISQQTSLRHLARKLDCSFSLLRKIELRLKKKFFPRYIRYLSIETRETFEELKDSQLAEEIQSNRRQEISVKDTIKRLKISLYSYYNILQQFDHSVKKDNYPPSIVDEIIHDRQNKVLLRETVKRLGISKYMYQKIVSEKKLPLLKRSGTSEYFQEIKSDRAKNISAAETANRLGISMNLYRSIVKKEKLPAITAIFYKASIIEQLKKNHEAGMSNSESAKSLGLSTHVYYKLVTKYNIPHRRNFQIRNRKDIVKEIQRDRTNGNAVAETLQRLKISEIQYYKIAARKSLNFLPVSDTSTVAEIKKDRTNSITLKDTVRRLKIPLFHYCNIVAVEKIPYQPFLRNNEGKKIRRDTLIEEIKRDRMSGINSNETIFRLGISNVQYSRTVSEQKLPLLPRTAKRGAKRKERDDDDSPKKQLSLNASPTNITLTTYNFLSSAPVPTVTPPSLKGGGSILQGPYISSPVSRSPYDFQEPIHEGESFTSVTETLDD